MADPLSIIASIIAVIGAAEGVTKTFQKIKNIRKAPSELLALINEVSDLRIVLANTESHLNQNAVTSKSQPLNHLQHLAVLLQRAKNQLLQLDELTQYRLIKADSRLESMKVSRREWATSKDTIENFRRSLRDIRLNIIGQMSVLNAYAFSLSIQSKNVRMTTQ